MEREGKGAQEYVPVWLTKEDLETAGMATAFYDEELCRVFRDAYEWAEGR